MVLETQLYQTAREVAGATGQPVTDSTLMEFGECAVSLRNILYQDKPLAVAEIRFIENHFHVLEMAYLRWKRRAKAENWRAYMSINSRSEGIAPLTIQALSGSLTP